MQPNLVRLWNYPRLREWLVGGLIDILLAHPTGLPASELHEKAVEVLKPSELWRDLPWSVFYVQNLYRKFGADDPVTMKERKEEEKEEEEKEEEEEEEKEEEEEEEKEEEREEEE